MSSEIPPLPNEAPQDLKPEERRPVRPVVPPRPAPPEPPQPAPAVDAPEVQAPAPEPVAPPSAPSARVVARPAPPSPAPPAPAMPAMPAAEDEADDDDDLEIPDEEDVRWSGSAGPQRSSEGEDDEEPLPAGVLKGTIVTARDDGAFVDVGLKSEAFLQAPRGAKKPEWKAGDVVEGTVTGRSSEGYLLLAPMHAQRPVDWSHLESAYAAKATVAGKVIEQVKGGLAVDVGARAFLPASRSGEREAAGLAALIGQEIRAKIVQLDIADRNVVLDRRVVLDEERDRQRREAVSGIREGAIVTGVVRSIREFGAFVDLGGIDALLHVSDISWSRVNDVASVLREGQEIEVQVLRVDDSGRKIAVGRKQLQSDPWTQAGEKFQVGDRVRGTVTRLKDFGAFVELLPGADGLIHVSEMSWAKRVRHPGDLLKVGDEVEAIVLDMNLSQRRIALGLKQALGDPWERVEREMPIGTAVEGVVRKTTNFGAFVEVADGVEGLLHVSDITSERRLNHPNEALKVGDTVRAQVTELDRAKRRLKLSMKQLEPTEQDRFVEAIAEGEVVSGRVLGLRDDRVEVELGEGVRGSCPKDAFSAPAGSAGEAPGGDVSALGAKLEAAWRGGAGAPAAPKAGQLRSFRVVRVDRASGRIELEPAE